MLSKSSGYGHFPSPLSAHELVLSQKILPEIFADGLPDNPDAKTMAITLWGVTIDPANPIDAKVSVVLMKFLRAR